MLEIKETKWVIMDKARTIIAKGVPRNRHLVPVDKPDKKRILFYSSYGMAKNGFSTGFYTYEIPNRKNWDDYDLEPVEVEIIIKEIEKKTMEGQ